MAPAYGPAIAGLTVRVDDHHRRLNEHMGSIVRIDEKIDGVEETLHRRISRLGGRVSKIELANAKVYGIMIGLSFTGSAGASLLMKAFGA